MAIEVKKFIGSNGEVLIPISQNASNSANLVSTQGTYFLAITEDTSTPLQGNPMGLLLTLTYASDQ